MDITTVDAGTCTKAGSWCQTPGIRRLTPSWGVDRALVQGWLTVADGSHRRFIWPVRPHHPSLAVSAKGSV